MNRSMEKRVAWLERRTLPGPPEPHLLMIVVDASGDPDNDAGDTDVPELPVFGYTADHTSVLRLDGETVDELQARCATVLEAPKVWFPITEAA